MKRYSLILFLYLLLPVFSFAQGTTCATAINIPLDDLLRIYSSSSSTGANVFCINNGTTPITWFKFTTNATAECPLLNITALDGQACEIAMYSSCAGSVNSVSSMCFYDGQGFWAPSFSSPISANRTYYLRIKTSTACNIQIAGKHYTPPNDNCAGAFSISNTAMTDNNACHNGGPGVFASQLCAFSLENTAFYKFYVATTGFCIVNINNINCDNGASNNSNGFQVGFFSGDCGTLNWLFCDSNSNTAANSLIQFTTPSLTAGTKVTVAIDGNQGSNCSYSINGLNIIGILTGNLKYFSGWKTMHSNYIKWMVLNEQQGYYVIERSLNGTNFTPIGRVQNNTNGTNSVTYEFEDNNPPIEAYYRLKQYDASGKTALSNIIFVNRGGLSNFQVGLNNPVGNMLNLNVLTDIAGTYYFSIMNMQGQQIISQTKSLVTGINQFNIEVAKLPQGQYALLIGNDKGRINKMFIKN